MTNFTLKRGYRHIEQLIRDKYQWEYEDYYEKYLKDTSVKPYLSEKDWFWSLLNNMIVGGVNSSSIYLIQAIFVHKYEGKSGTPYDRLMIQENLKRMIDENSSYTYKTHIVISSDNDSCEHGKSMDNCTYPIAINNINPGDLATDKCTNQRCHCFYSILPERDKDGRMIRK